MALALLPTSKHHHSKSYEKRVPYGGNKVVQFNMRLLVISPPKKDGFVGPISKAFRWASLCMVDCQANNTMQIHIFSWMAGAYCIYV